MLRFLKKRQAEGTYQMLKTDLHSHLLPGLDDGSTSMKESLRLLRSLEKLGFQKVITTPHVMVEYYPNTPEKIQTSLEELRQAAQKAKINIKLEAAAEYYLDEYFAELLEKDEILTFNDNHLLFEISFVSIPSNIEEMIFRMRTKGYQPVLAHPERYIHRKVDYPPYDELKKLGVKYQVNIPSLVGFYGRPTKDAGYELIRRGHVEFLGSDLHNPRMSDFLWHGHKSNRLRKMLKEVRFENHKL